MNGKSIEKKIFILIVFMILIIISLLIIILRQKNNDKIDENFVEYAWIEEKVEKPKDLKSNSQFYALIKCIDEFAEAFNKDMSEAYKMLDDFYLKKNNLTTYKDLKIDEQLFKGYITYIANDIKYISRDNVFVYYIYGNTIVNTSNGEIVYGEYYNKEVNLIIKLDYNNKKFSIIPEHFENMYEDDKLLEKLTDDKYKTFNLETISNKVIAKKYIDNYMYCAFDKIQESYNMIDAEYRTKKFSDSFENYKNYVEKYLDYYKVSGNTSIEKCNTFEVDENNIYVAKTEEKCSFIINEAAVNKFTILLDRYTVITDEIKQIYEELSEMDKAEYNCENIINSLQTEDYEYSYEKLTSELKQSSFKTLENYKNYMTQNTLKGFNIIQNEKITKKGKDYTYTATLLDVINENTKKITIDLKLEEDMNFKVSFIVE